MDGRCAKSGCGQRSRTAWKTTTASISSKRASLARPTIGISAPMVLDGPMAAEWLLACTEQLLVPTLRPATS